MPEPTKFPPQIHCFVGSILHVDIIIITTTTTTTMDEELIYDLHPKHDILCAGGYHGRECNNPGLKWWRNNILINYLDRYHDAEDKEQIRKELLAETTRKGGRIVRVLRELTDEEKHQRDIDVRSKKKVYTKVANRQIKEKLISELNRAIKKAKNQAAAIVSPTRDDEEEHFSDRSDNDGGGGFDYGDDDDDDDDDDAPPTRSKTSASSTSTSTSAPALALAPAPPTSSGGVDDDNDDDDDDAPPTRSKTSAASTSTSAPAAPASASAPAPAPAAPAAPASASASPSKKRTPSKKTPSKKNTPSNTNPKKKSKSKSKSKSTVSFETPHRRRTN